MNSLSKFHLNPIEYFGRFGDGFKNGEKIYRSDQCHDLRPSQGLYLRIYICVNTLQLFFVYTKSSNWAFTLLFFIFKHPCLLNVDELMGINEALTLFESKIPLIIQYTCIQFLV